MHFSFSCYVPTILPVDDAIGLSRAHEALLNEIDGIELQLKLLFTGAMTTTVTVEAYRDSHKHIEFASAWRPRPTGRHHAFMRLVGSFEANVDSIKIGDEVSDSRLSTLMIESSIVEALEPLVAKIALCAAIAKPGAVEFDPGLIFVNDAEVGETRAFVSTLMPARERAFKRNWPPIQDMPFEAVWRWIEAIPSIAGGVGKGKVGRGLAAFAYLLRERHSSTPVDLLWGLIGLEALYSGSNEGLSEQLRAKSEVLLGPRFEFKKQVNDMYAFRSKLVHGGADLPFPMHLEDEETAIRQFGDDQYDAELTASAMLVSTLQALAQKGWNELVFEYKLKEPGAREA